MLLAFTHTFQQLECSSPFLVNSYTALQSGWGILPINLYFPVPWHLPQDCNCLTACLSQPLGTLEGPHLSHLSWIPRHSAHCLINAGCSIPANYLKEWGEQQGSKHGWYKKHGIIQGACFGSSPSFSSHKSPWLWLSLRLVFVVTFQTLMGWSDSEGRLCFIPSSPLTSMWEALFYCSNIQEWIS